MTATHCLAAGYHQQSYGLYLLILLRQGHINLLSGLPAALTLTKGPGYKDKFPTLPLKCVFYASATVSLLGSLRFVFQKGVNALDNRGEKCKKSPTDFKSDFIRMQ